MGSSDIRSPDGTITYHAFLWEEGTMIDLGTLGGYDSYAFALNNRGQVVGSSSTSSGESYAFLWENGTMINLGALNGDFSYAVATNKRGQIVGNIYTFSGKTRAVLWQR